MWLEGYDGNFNLWFLIPGLSSPGSKVAIVLVGISFLIYTTYIRISKHIEGKLFMDSIVIRWNGVEDSILLRFANFNPILGCLPKYQIITYTRRDVLIAGCV